jgi:hypothetical protein
MKDTEFNYLEVLRNLEISLKRRNHNKDIKLTAKDSLSRAYPFFRDRLNLITTATQKHSQGDKKIFRNLKLTADRLQRTESSILENINKLTSFQNINTNNTKQIWPPIIPVGRMTECFVALTIGLQSENPDIHISECIAVSFKETINSTLAWGIICSLNSQPGLQSESLLNTISEKITEIVKNADYKLVHENEKIDLPYIKLISAWFELLKEYELGEDKIADLAKNLSDLLKGGFDEIVKKLWAKLSTHYSPSIHATDRAKAVLHASRFSGNDHSAFINSRFVLLEAAQNKEAIKFKSKIDTEFKIALNHAEAFLKKTPSHDIALQACGMAFWLAKKCYRTVGRIKTIEEDDYDKASDLVIRLLEYGYKNSTNSAEQRNLCLRYAAGFATNPRYWRSKNIILKQNELVSNYENDPLSRKCLVHSFKARVAWYNSIKDPSRLSECFDHYFKATNEWKDQKNGLDSEAPIHLFPEIAVLLLAQSKKQKSHENPLKIIDFILERQFGIYFDKDREQNDIFSGLKMHQ